MCTSISCRCHSPSEQMYRHRDERISATLRTVIGLLAATGLRIGETLNLRVPDIDQHNDLLMIKAAKSHERLVPVRRRPSRGDSSAIPENQSSTLRPGLLSRKQ